jgi:hypothetical protein
VPADPTDADRERAMVVLTGPVDYHIVRDKIAQALADERQRARAPFLALADQYARDPIIGRAVALAIRAAALEDPK